MAMRIELEKLETNTDRLKEELDKLKEENKRLKEEVELLEGENKYFDGQVEAYCSAHQTLVDALVGLRSDFTCKDTWKEKAEAYKDEIIRLKHDTIKFLTNVSESVYVEENFEDKRYTFSIWHDGEEFMFSLNLSDEEKHYGQNASS